MTELIKRYPVKVTATEIKQGLDNFGYETSLRTVQRDLNELSRIFPIECDDISTPFGWSWKKDSPGY